MNQYNNNGEKHGPWEVYYNNGKLNYKVGYINNLCHGLCEIYWDNGQLQFKGEYMMGTEIGFWYEYNPDGSSIEPDFFL